MNRIPELLLNYIDVVKGRAFPIEQNNKYITELVIYFDNLLKEIERLNKELETIKDNFDFNLGAIENIRKENHSLEERIDKAIEYAENEIEGAKGCIYRELPEETYIEYWKEILDILKGVDKE